MYAIRSYYGGADLQFHMEVSFLDALNGATKQVSFPEMGRVEISAIGVIPDA